LKDQFEELKRRDSDPAPPLDEILDSAIRLRFGEIIYRATKNARE
jgi:hypothetical protein